MNEEKIYVANGKTHAFKDGNTLVKFALNLTKLRTTKEYFYEINGSQYINLEIAKKKVSPDAYGKTHAVTVDTFKPDKTQVSKAADPAMAQGADEFEDDIPF